MVSNSIMQALHCTLRPRAYAAWPGHAASEVHLWPSLPQLIADSQPRLIALHCRFNSPTEARRLCLGCRGLLRGH